MDNNYVYLYAEKKANKFNLYCLLVIAILGFMAIILNEVGIFTMDKVMMRISMYQLMFYSVSPFIIYLIHDKYCKCHKSILEKSFFKVIIIIVAFVSIMIVCISMSFHVTILLVIPPLLSSQYKASKRMYIIVTIISLISVPVAIYGSYFFGMYDANLLKPLSELDADKINNRFDIATPKRMVTVFYHYVMPLWLCLGAIDYIALAISRRTRNMIDVQIDLNNKVNKEIEERSHMQNAVIEHLADIIETRDIETGEHIKRTKKYVTILVNAMQNEERYKDILNDKLKDLIINAAPLHDIGKIAVSDLILCKPGKLTDEEFDKMKVHTTKGGEIINNILNDMADKEFLNVAFDVAVYHHEKWNGRGYPKGLKEEEIPLSARIMAIADVFDALVAERVYKKPMPVDDAINIIINDAGTHFDPYLVEVFKKVIDEFKNASKEKL